MLQEPMKCVALITLLCSLLPGLVLAQVELNTNIRLVGSPDERRVDDVAAPVTNTSAIRVVDAVLGTPHWAEATVNGQEITLQQSVQALNYRPGMLLRFLCPDDLDGEVLLRVQGQPFLPLRRSDDGLPVRSQLRDGGIVEVVHAQDKWILMSPAEKGCPEGAIKVNDFFCMDADPSGTMSAYPAMELCTAQGGKLCTWEEYFLGCSLYGEQLTGLLEWEWTDETSNHSHVVDQSGRFSCMSQRSWNPVNGTGQVRCCYQLR
jgi:hypothetical protein